MNPDSPPPYVGQSISIINLMAFVLLTNLT